MYLAQSTTWELRSRIFKGALSSISGDLLHVGQNCSNINLTKNLFSTGHFSSISPKYTERIELEQIGQFPPVFQR